MKIKNNENRNIKNWIIILLFWLLLTYIVSHGLSPSIHSLYNWIKTSGINGALKSEIKQYTRILIAYAIITLIVIIYWTKILIKEYKKSKVIKYLKKVWTQKNWNIKRIIRQRDQINTDYYIITATDWNRDYTSDKIYSKIQYLTKKWDNAEILIDPFNPNTYYINKEKILEKQVDECCVNDFIIGDNTQNDKISESFDSMEETLDQLEDMTSWIRIPIRRENKLLSEYLWRTSIWLRKFYLILWIVLTTIGILIKNNLKVKHALIIIWITIILDETIYIYKHYKNKAYINNMKKNWTKVNAVISEIKKTKLFKWLWYKILAVNWNNIYTSPKIYSYITNRVKTWDHVTQFI